jgi:hypothetical protein
MGCFESKNFNQIDLTNITEENASKLGFHDGYNDFITGKVLDPKTARRVHRNAFSSMRSYNTQRLHLRTALAYNFVHDSDNIDIMTKIKGLRAIITMYPELCEQAAIEIKKEVDFVPTSVESCIRELRRIYYTYEIERKLKSVIARIGPVACPLGHQTVEFNEGTHPDLSKKNEKHGVFNAAIAQKREKNKGKYFSVPCKICNVQTKSGYNCTYCCYFNVCHKCCVIYCREGHVMKLWTNPEAELICFVCKVTPLIAGYHCNECMDFDICDMCSYKEGRLYIQQTITDEMTEVYLYLKSIIEESDLAFRTVNFYELKEKYVITDPCPTTLEVFNRLKYYRAQKEQAVYEMLFDRLRKRVFALRNQYFVHIEICVTKLHQAFRPLVISEDECERFGLLIEEFEAPRKQDVRCSTCIACPVGHAMFKYEGSPETYHETDVIDSDDDNADDDFFFKELMDENANRKHMILHCRVCNRVAKEGYHCKLCEYEYCLTCTTVHCTLGHAMSMWALDEAENISCYLCSAQSLTKGYHCNTCGTDMCDMCTLPAKRNERKQIIAKEIARIMAYMNENRRKSDVARYYHWRKMNYVVSEGILCEYLSELRIAEHRAQKQVKYKLLIDEMKLLRKQVISTLPAEICGAAARELTYTPLYYFDSKKEAQRELNRLKSVMDLNMQAKTVKARSMCSIACPLAHAMVPIIVSLANSSDQSDYIKRNCCRVCQDATVGGHVCLLCEYELCKSCSDINCRYGHVCTLWTMPDAFGLTCNICLSSNLKSGYRCTQCEVDICDICTLSEAREALKLLPKKEIKRVLIQLEMLKDKSSIAKTYYERNMKDKNKKYLSTMTLLCKELADLKNAKIEAEAELANNKNKYESTQYGNRYLDA